MSRETRYAMYFIAFMMSVKLHKYKIVTIYYRSELSGGHCRSAATMPLHVVCRGEECRSGTSVIFPRRQMDRWMEAMRDIVSREASSVEDPEGVGDDPSVDPEVGDGPIVGVVFVVVFVLLVELDFDFRFELFELLFAFLLFEGLPVRAEGAGTRGEGDPRGGQPHVPGHLQLAGQLVQGGRGRRLRI